MSAVTGDKLAVQAGVFQLISGAAPTDSREDMAKAVIERAERINAENNDIRAIMLYLATADAAGIAKIVAAIPAAGQTISVGDDEYIYVPKIGYVLNTSDLIAFRDGVMTRIVYSVTTSADTAVYKDSAIEFRNNVNMYTVKFAPHGEHLRIESTTTLPHSIAATAPFTDFNCYNIKKFVDNRVTEATRHEGDRIITYSYDTYGTIATLRVVKGNRTELTNVKLGTRTISKQLHPDVIYVKPDYHLTTVMGKVIFSHGATTLVGSADKPGGFINGFANISPTHYSFNFHCYSRIFRVVRGAGKEFTLEEE